MERINCIVTDEAKANLVKYKKQEGLKSLDDALDLFLRDVLPVVIKETGSVKKP